LDVTNHFGAHSTIRYRKKNWYEICASASRNPSTLSGLGMEIDCHLIQCTAVQALKKPLGATEVTHLHWLNLMSNYFPDLSTL